MSQSKANSEPEYTQDGQPEGSKTFQTRDLPGILRESHQDIYDDRRYTITEIIREAMDGELKSPDSKKMHEICMERLPFVFLEIMMDPRIYVWIVGHESPYYHCELERYVANIYHMFIACWTYMIDSKNFNRYYKGFAKQLLESSPALWPVLWENRAVLGPDVDDEIEYDENGMNDGFRGDVVSVISRVMECSLHLYGNGFDTVPSLSLGMVELLIYCWQYHPPLQSRALAVRLATVLLIPNHRSLEEHKKVISKVIPDEETAFRMAKILYNDLRNRNVVNEFLSHHHEFLYVLVSASPLFVRAGMPLDNPDRSIFRCVAMSCQRQLCLRSEEESQYEFPNIGQGLASIELLVKDHAMKMGRDGNMQFYDLESVEVLCRIASQVLIPSARLIIPRLYNTVIAIWKVYADSLTIIDVESRGGRLMNFYKILRHCWFKAMAELKQIRLEPWRESYSVLNEWRNIGTKLGIEHTRFSKLPEDPEDAEKTDRMCHWKDCLCHKIVPYRRLRVCTGCWKVFYCSTMCQTKDWKRGGHRRKCIGRRETSSKKRDETT